jgi:hypothetical protein
MEIFQNMTDLTTFAQTLVKGVENQATCAKNEYSYAYGKDNLEGGITGILGTSSYTLDLPEPVELGFTQDRMAGFPLVGKVGSQADVFVQTDCSGFIAYALQQVSPATYAQLCVLTKDLKTQHSELQVLDRKHNQPWPSAADFTYTQYAQNGQLPAQLAVVATQQTLVDVLTGGLAPAVGDILAWDNPAGAEASIADTGHVMILQSGFAKADAEGAYQIQVCDCSGPHMHDTRTRAGAGNGTIGAEYRTDGWYFNFTDEPSNAFQPMHFTILRLAADNA